MPGKYNIFYIYVFFLDLFFLAIKMLFIIFSNINAFMDLELYLSTSLKIWHIYPARYYTLQRAAISSTPGKEPSCLVSHIGP
jgi:hypothetical protein